VKTDLIPTKYRGLPAFTLIEMMVVMALISLLMVVSSMSVGGMLAAQQLTSSSNRFTNEMAYAAQLAVRENRMVGVRFLRRQVAPGLEAPLLYQGWQLMLPDRTTGKWRPYGEVNLLDNSTIMVENSAWSNILSRSSMVGEDAVEDVVKTPPVFAFKPEGGTTLPRGETDPKWCVTFALEKDVVKAGETDPTTLPDNYRTLVINAHTGAVVLY
jgi:uncharacterized protein (TIGR02596 family)